MVIADVEIGHALANRFHHLRIAVAERIGAAVQMDVDEPAPIHVPEIIALAPVDHEIDAHALPVGCLAGIPELFRAGEEVVFCLAHRPNSKDSLSSHLKESGNDRLARRAARLDMLWTLPDSTNFSDPRTKL